MGALVAGFTVQEAAEALGVSRVRVQHMIRDNRLAAERVGNRWIIPRHEVFRSQRVPRPGGRPYTAANCWDIIDDLDRGRRTLDWLHDNWHLLSSRAHHTTGRMLPDLIADVYDDRQSSSAVLTPQPSVVSLRAPSRYLSMCMCLKRKRPSTCQASVCGP